VDEYVVITGPDVDLGEVLGIAEFCNEGGNQWQGVSVPDRPFIDIPIILTGSKVAPFLSNKKEPACLGRLQGTDEVFSDVVVKEGFYGFRFFWGKRVCLGGFRDITGFCVDSMINTWSVWWEFV